MRSEYITHTENPFRGLKQHLPFQIRRVNRVLERQKFGTTHERLRYKFTVEQIEVKLQKARDALKSGNMMPMLVACSALKEIE